MIFPFLLFLFFCKLFCNILVLSAHLEFFAQMTCNLIQIKLKLPKDIYSIFFIYSSIDAHEFCLAEVLAERVFPSAHDRVRKLNKIQLNFKFEIEKRNRAVLQKLKHVLYNRHFPIYYTTN